MVEIIRRSMVLMAVSTKGKFNFLYTFFIVSLSDEGGSATHSVMTPEKGTYLDAMRRILRDATTLDKELQKDLKRQYDIILINVLKHIIVSDSLSMKSVYDAEHLHLLKSLPSLLLSSRTSLRQKLGVIYLSLPFSVAYRLKSLIS